MQLDTTQSIVDNFKALGLPSDFSTRASVFKNLGLENRLGKYVGSGTQNPNYIKALKGFTPDQLQGALKAPLSQPTTLIAPETPVPQPTPTPTAPTTLETPSGGSVPINGTNVLKSLGISEPLNAQDITNQVLNAPQFQTFQNRQATNETLNTAEAQAQKQRLETENAAKVKSFQNQLERNGMSLSGQFNVGTTQLLDELAASKLGVDRDLAGKLLNSNFNLQDEIAKQATSIIDRARQGRQDAIRALEASGLTVVGNQVVPTLAASNAARAETNAAATQQRFEAGQAATEQRFQQSQQGLEAQRAESNALRQQSLAIQQQNAGTLAALRNLQIQALKDTAQGQVISAATGLGVKLDNASATKIADYQTSLGQLDYVKNLLAQVQSTGAVKGWVVKNGVYVPVVQRELNPNEVELMQELGRLTNQYVYTVSGKQINEQEFVRVSKTTPSIQATTEANNRVIKNFDRFLNDGLNNYLRVRGWKLATQGTGAGTSAPAPATNVNISGLNFKF